MLSVGARLGVYELLSPLGAGGMGEVWKARDTRLDRIVAIKHLKAQHSHRFEQEARSIAALNHPHICQLYDVGPDYLVLEYVEGSPLRGRLPVEEAVRTAIQIASALEEAHSRNILHRDLKPANIMVTPKGSVKLLDFGLAKLTASSEDDVTRTLEGTIMGTVAYMAPEQAEGKPLDVRSDIFSFGAVLYEMLGGSRAFSGGSTAQVVSAVLRDDPRPLDVPAALDRIVRKCLAKQPEQRFQTMAEVRAALEQVSSKPAQEHPSIAVLPFANMSSSKEDEYFSDGLAEEIINLLAHIPGLKVTARTSAFAFRGKEQDIRQIADTLDVKTVLEGSVRRAGNRVRITAQLINAADGYHLWSEKYDRELNDVFAVQDEIAAAITKALQLKLTPAVAIRERYKPKLPAYEALLRGRVLQHAFPTPESVGQVKELYERAIALDAEYALPHAELGLYFLAIAHLGIRPAREMMPLIREHARKALAIDPSLPEAHAMLGVVAGVYEYEWNEAEREFSLAFAHDPVPLMARLCYGTFYLVPKNRYTEAVNELARALEEDPLSGLCRSVYSTCLLGAGRNAEGVREAHKLLELDPNNAAAYGYLAVEQLSRGGEREALAFAEQAYGKAPWFPFVAGLFAGLLARTGNRARAEEIRAGLAGNPASGVPVAQIIFYCLCGEAGQADEWVAKAAEQRHPALPGLLRGPVAKLLQSSPHYREWLRMINLPED